MLGQALRPWSLAASVQPAAPDTAPPPSSMPASPLSPSLTITKPALHRRVPPNLAGLPGAPESLTPSLLPDAGRLPALGMALLTKGQWPGTLIPTSREANGVCWG